MENLSAGQQARLIEIEAQNYGRLRYCVIHPSERLLTEITGKNDAGKSTALTLVDAVLDTRSMKELPVTQGESKGQIVSKWEVTLENGNKLIVTITRTYSEKNPSGRVVIEPAIVGQYTTPAQIIENVFGKERLLVDPMGFAKLKGKEQVQILVNAVGKAPDVSKLKEMVQAGGIPDPVIDGDDPYSTLMNAYKIVFTHRTDVKRQRKDLDAVISALPANKVEKVEVSKLQEERAATEKYNTAVAEVDHLKTQKTSIENQISQLQEQLAAVEKEIKTKSDEVDSWPKVRTVEQIDADIANASDTNMKAAKYAERKEKEVKLKELDASIYNCDKALEMLVKYRSEVLDLSSLGIEGLELTEEGLLSNGIPVSELGATKRALLGLRIQHALNPSMKLIRIDEWDTYDGEHKELVLKFAEEHDMNVLVARVAQADEKTGIEIVDGEFVNHYE